jgi:hypothetical protein
MNASFVMSNGAQQSEKSVKSTGCKYKISRLRLEMTVLGQAPSLDFHGIEYS